MTVRRARQRSSLRVLVAVGVLALALACVPDVRPTLAAFSDSAGLRSSTLTAASLAAPSGLTCTNGPALLGYVDLAWTSRSAGAGHRVEVESTPGSWITLASLPPGASTFRVASSMVGSVLSLGATYRVRVAASAGGSWTSLPTSTVSISTLSLLIGIVVVCA